MIHVIGDIHGDFSNLWTIVQDIPEEDSIIQVGDFGVWAQVDDKDMRTCWERPDQRRGDIFFVDGNHDYIPMLPVDSSELTEIWSNLWYMPRGYVGMVEDKRVLFLGGSKSVDRKWRPLASTDHGWFPEEQLNDVQVERAIANVAEAGEVDLIVSHTPPDWIIRKHLDPSGLLHFDIDSKTWIDESAKNVERVWEALGGPSLISGHLHKKIVDGNIRVLGINEHYTLGE